MQRFAVNEKDVFGAFAERSELGGLQIHVVLGKDFGDGIKQSQTVGGDDIEDESSSGFVGLNLHRRTGGKVPRTARKPAFRRERQGFPVGQGGSEVPFELSQTVSRSELREGVVSHKGVERPAVRSSVNARIDHGEARFAEKGDCPQK